MRQTSPEERKPPMATRKAEKKKKKVATAKKQVPKLKAKKKFIKPTRKKMIKKPKKPTARKMEPTKATLPEDKNAAIKKMLLEMRDKLKVETSDSLIPESLAASTDIGDVIDQAGDERDRELSLLLTGREKEKLLAINEALEKLKDGTYGVCEECGEKIGQGRLKVMPLAKYCVSCQSKIEKELSLQKKAEEDLKYRGLAYATNTEEEEI